MAPLELTRPVRQEPSLKFLRERCIPEGAATGQNYPAAQLLQVAEGLQSAVRHSPGPVAENGVIVVNKKEWFHKFPESPYLWISLVKITAKRVNRYSIIHGLTENGNGKSESPVQTLKCCIFRVFKVFTN